MPWNAARNGPNNDIKCFSHGCSLYDNTDPLSRPATSGPGKRCEAYFTADPRIGPAWRAKPSLRQLPQGRPVLPLVRPCTDQTTLSSLFICSNSYIAAVCE